MKNTIKKYIPTPLMRFLYSLKKTLKGKIPVHVTNVFGFDIYQNVNDIINYKNFSGKNFEEVSGSTDGRVFSAMSKYITKDSVAIDVGANIGLMTLAMSKLVGNKGKVLSFEPGPVSYGLLRRNVYSNVLNGNVTISDNALSDSLGSFNLFINMNGESDNQLHKDVDQYNFKDEPSRPKIVVNTETLDNYLLKNHIDFKKVSFVKIDTQGHDLFVLRGGHSLFSKTSKIAVLVEFCPYLKAWESHSISEFYEQLESFGFDIYDDSNLQYGKINLNYLKSNYGSEKVGKYTDLLLLKGQGL